MKHFFIIWILLSLPMQMIAQICPGTPGSIKWECWENMYDDEFLELYSKNTYPARPDLVKTLYRLQSKLNYTENIGVRIRGYINVDTSTIATFNLTADDKARFYLSTDSQPENKQLLTFLNNASQEEEHDQDSTQTSAPIALTAGIDYYFELIYIERTGRDFATIWWKTDLVNPNEWNIITSKYIKGIGCLPEECPPMGTPCDDGNVATSNDQEDGSCNCKGAPNTTNQCVGDQSLITHYIYDSIPNSSLSSLYSHEDYPAMPSMSVNLSEFGTPLTKQMDDFGSTIYAFLTVPVTGIYQFALTGDNNTKVFISSDDDPANKLDLELTVNNNTKPVQFDRYESQISDSIQLDAEQYYYIELNHKEGSGSEHFALFWKTPLSTTSNWKRIPSFYIYDYGCELACIPEGTPCDDGNIYTNNDMYNDSCQCVGTPCSGSDCDNLLASYIPKEKCSPTNQLDNNEENNWLSCDKSQNPNPARGITHWIQYDLGLRHELYQTQIWNYNVLGQLDQGFQSVAIDYSEDGNTWTELGTYNWPMADGENNYSGFQGPNFDGVGARYVIITSLDGAVGCKGIGKVAFTAIVCPLAGATCDDKDFNTILDKYDAFCNCAGIRLDSNLCAEDILFLGDSILQTNLYGAKDYIEAVSSIDDESSVGFVGGNSVILEVGFESEIGAVFSASIDDCIDPVSSVAFDQLLRIKEIKEEKKQAKKNAAINLLTVRQVTGTDQYLVQYFVKSSGEVKVNIGSEDGSSYTLVNHAFLNGGVYQKRFRSKKLRQGLHTIQLTTATDTKIERIMIN